MPMHNSKDSSPIEPYCPLLRTGDLLERFECYTYKKYLAGQENLFIKGLHEKSITEEREINLHVASKFDIPADCPIMCSTNHTLMEERIEQFEQFLREESPQKFKQIRFLKDVLAIVNRDDESKETYNIFFGHYKQKEGIWYKIKDVSFDIAKQVAEKHEFESTRADNMRYIKQKSEVHSVDEGTAWENRV